MQVHMGVLNKQHKVAIKTLQSDSMPEIHRFEAVSVTRQTSYGSQTDSVGSDAKVHDPNASRRRSASCRIYTICRTS